MIIRKIRFTRERDRRFSFSLVRLMAFQALLARIPLALHVIINYSGRSSPARRGRGGGANEGEPGFIRVRGESNDRRRSEGANGRETNRR